MCGIDFVHGTNDLVPYPWTNLAIIQSCLFFKLLLVIHLSCTPESFSQHPTHTENKFFPLSPPAPPTALSSSSSQSSLPPAACLPSPQLPSSLALAWLPHVFVSAAASSSHLLRSCSTVPHLPWRGSSGKQGEAGGGSRQSR